MPVVRFEVRNEFKLGQPKSYKEVNKEDPKAILDGVAVSGLVGILRQLGDLAEFAAEVFHGLQEQVMTTASRSHKLVVRVQKIEVALPSIEKAVLTQTSHIHFAYTAGCEWRSRIQNRQNHFIYNELPRFIMDSYEECRDPPRLHLLDKFDTGGPGSCLKRYSDPTFFRKASGNFKEPDAEKGLKEKKSRKTKRKRSSQRNVDFLRSASMPNRAVSMQFTTTTATGRTSPSHTASTADMTLKSDLGDHSNSFDSRTGSTHVECVFRLSSSAQPEEQESKEFSSRSYHNDIADSVVSDEQPSIANDNFHHSSSSEPIAPSSSGDTWDEKAEVMGHIGVHFDENINPKMFSTDSDQGTQNGEIADLRNPYQIDTAFDHDDTPKSSAAKNFNHIDIVFVKEAAPKSSSSQTPDQMDMLIDNEDTPKSSTTKNELDEVDSEPDDYEDALNTIESESENDLDYQMNHEAEQFSVNVDNEATVDEANEVKDYTSNDSPEKESHIVFDLPLNNGTFGSKISVPSDSISSERTSHISQDDEPGSKGVAVANSDGEPGSKGVTSADAIDGLKVEPAFSVGDPSFSGREISSITEPLIEKAVCSSHKSQEPPAELDRFQPVSFWTNGGLLGLQPSKPPDFAVANALNKDSKTVNNVYVIGPPNLMAVLGDGEERGGPAKLVENCGSSERVPSSECCNSQILHQDTVVDETRDLHHSFQEGNKVASAVKAGKEVPLDTKTTSIKENEENSSQMFGIGHRLLMNGLRTKLSLVSDSEPSLLKTDASERRNGHHNLTNQAASDNTFNGKFLYETTAVGSLTSSPPLEHMKISFHPIDGFEASKLNLKFPDNNHSNGSIRDMFPAFQLVPESTVPSKYAASDSDNDTFCRISPYMSEDGVSHHSDSDSEQWETESDDSPENNGHELYNALYRISPVDSVSSSQKPTELCNNGSHIESVYIENGVDASLSSSMLDLPSFDAMNTVISGKSVDNLEARNLMELHFPKDTNPSPPPPPPVQWRATKTTSCMAENEWSGVSEDHKHMGNLRRSVSMVSQPHKPAPTNGQQMSEVVAFELKNKLDQLKLDRRKEGNLSSNTKEMDEKEDFLHQIRMKSFTLRRTVTAKPNLSSAPVAKDKVTAILEKAIAIRQAVGSDEGEDDDTWSDT